MNFEILNNEEWFYTVFTKKWDENLSQLKEDLKKKFQRTLIEKKKIQKNKKQEKLLTEIIENEYQNAIKNNKKYYIFAFEHKIDFYKSSPSQISLKNGKIYIDFLNQKSFDNKFQFEENEIPNWHFSDTFFKQNEAVDSQKFIENFFDEGKEGKRLLHPMAKEIFINFGVSAAFLYKFFTIISNS